MIGRGPEQDTVARFLDRVSDGRVALVIDGEAGIGKTTIWLEAVRRARERGYRVLLARPAEGERELSFAALADLIGDAVTDVGNAVPQPQRDALDAALLRRGTDQAIDPRTTGTGVVTVLTALAAEQPVIVAIDDLQWLDRPPSGLSGSQQGDSRTGSAWLSLGAVTAMRPCRSDSTVPCRPKRSNA